MTWRTQAADAYATDDDRWRCGKRAPRRPEAEAGSSGFPRKACWLEIDICCRTIFNGISHEHRRSDDECRFVVDERSADRG
jgi:hypothetical protein